MQTTKVSPNSRPSPTAPTCIPTASTRLTSISTKRWWSRIIRPIAFKSSVTSPTTNTTAHVSINNDTLHLMGWLDVAAEPVIVSVPDHDDGRYWVLHSMDMGHYTTPSLASGHAAPRRPLHVCEPGLERRSSGRHHRSRPRRKQLHQLMGRVMATGVEDEKKALTYVDDWNIRTLSEFLGKAGPKPKERKFVPREGNSWLERVNFMLADGTMAAADAHWLKGLEASGIGAGKMDFTPEQHLAAPRRSASGI